MTDVAFKYRRSWAVCRRSQTQESFSTVSSNKGIAWYPANADLFPVVASLHPLLSDGEKRRPEIRLCSQAIVTQEIVSAQLSP